MKHKTLFAIAMTALSLCGCSNNNKSADDHPNASAATNVQDVPEPEINAETHFAAGQLAESRGELEPAAVQYRQTLKLDSSNARALYRLGCVYAQQRKFPEALDVWKKYVKATGEASSAYNNLAYAEELAGHPQEAEADYKKGIAKDPSDAGCRVNYGLMLARHGRPGEAVLQLQVVLRPAEVHYNLAEVYELQHQPEKAKLEYKQALALDPDFADAKAKLSSIAEPAPGDD